MRDKKVIPNIIVILICIIGSFNLFAETYTVIAFKNCSPTYVGRPIQVGDKVSDPTKLKENWHTAKGSKYIKLQSKSDNKIQIITQPSHSDKSDKDNFISWLWGCFSGQKKCSTRAPENELTGGLANNLSQTFYLLIPTDANEETDFSIASNLEEGAKLHCSYIYDNDEYNFIIPINNNAFTFSSKDFRTHLHGEDRIPLRINVEYLSQDGTVVSLTNSMNVICIPE